jgi:hypothetical protein
VSDFPLEKILQLELDEYVSGEPDPKEMRREQIYFLLPSRTLYGKTKQI